MDPDCESLWKKMIGKPYSGKLNVRFDEGELEIEPSATTPALYSTHPKRAERRDKESYNIMDVPLSPKEVELFNVGNQRPYCDP